MSDPFYQALKEECKKYMESEDYTSGAYKTDDYKICCKTYDFCAFYWQTWFWGLVGGLIFLAIIGSIIGSYCCCCRGRGGAGLEANFDDDSEPSEPSVKGKQMA